MPQTRPPGLADVWRQVAFYSSLGFIIPAGAIGGYGLGWLLDDWLHTRPVLSLVLGLAGAAGGIVEVIRILTRTERNADKNSKPGPGAS